MKKPNMDMAKLPEVKEIVLNILKCDEAEMDWQLQFLELNTGLKNLSDYIFYPSSVGLDRNASLEQIADKVIKDRKQQRNYYGTSRQ